MELKMEPEMEPKMESEMELKMELPSFPDGERWKYPKRTRKQHRRSAKIRPENAIQMAHCLASFLRVYQIDIISFTWFASLLANGVLWKTSISKRRATSKGKHQGNWTSASLSNIKNWSRFADRWHDRKANDRQWSAMIREWPEWGDFSKADPEWKHQPMNDVWLPLKIVYYENNTCNQNCEMCVSPVAAVRLNDSVTLP